MVRMMCASVLLVIVVVVPVGRVLAQPQYQLVDLGANAYPRALNDRNVVVGSVISAGQQLARWIDGELDVFGLGRADAINELGLIVGYGTTV
jgi:hypothetical protein